MKVQLANLYRMHYLQPFDVDGKLDLVPCMNLNEYSHLDESRVYEEEVSNYGKDCCRIGTKPRKLESSLLCYDISTSHSLQLICHILKKSHHVENTTMRI
jgi:hypothetical protein